MLIVQSDGFRCEVLIHMHPPSVITISPLLLVPSFSQTSFGCFVLVHGFALLQVIPFQLPW